MEPFGLLNLLKTLLPDPSQQGAPQAPQTDETSADPDPKTENAPPAPAQNEPPNACVSFLEEHEKRARRTRK